MVRQHTKPAGRAVPALRRILALTPDHLIAWALIGQAWMSILPLARAHDAFCRSLIPNPADADTRNGLGRVLQTLGAWADAWWAFVQAIELNAKSGEARANPANLLIHSDDVGLAFRLYRETLAF